MLCAAGLRSLLEGICHDQKAAGRNLEERIDSLQFVVPNKNLVRHLHAFRFTGNKAMHELEAPAAAGHGSPRGARPQRPGGALGRLGDCDGRTPLDLT